MRHYWRVTEADFEKAIGGKSGVECGQQAGQVNVWQGLDCGTKCGTVLAQNAAQQASAPVCEEEKFLPQSLVDFQVTQSVSNPARLVQIRPVPGRGLEPPPPKRGQGPEPCASANSAIRALENT